MCCVPLSTWLKHLLLLFVVSKDTSPAVTENSVVHSADGVQAPLQTQAAEHITTRSSNDNTLLIAAPGAISHNLRPHREKVGFKLGSY